MKFKNTDVTISSNPPIDDSDPGFTIKGVKLRWVSAGVEVRRAGRCWEALKISMLPENAVTKLKKFYPRWVEGDTIRKRDQVLAFAPIDEIEKIRRRNKDAQNANEAILRGKSRLSGGVIQSEGQMRKQSIETSQEFS